MLRTANKLVEIPFPSVQKCIMESGLCAICSREKETLFARNVIERRVEFMDGLCRTEPHANGALPSKATPIFAHMIPLLNLFHDIKLFFCGLLHFENRYYLLSILHELPSHFSTRCQLFMNEGGELRIGKFHAANSIVLICIMDKSYQYSSC